MKKIIIPAILSFSFLSTAQLPFSVPQKFLDAELKHPAGAEYRFPAEKIKSGEFASIKAKEWRACRQSANENLMLNAAYNPMAAHKDPLDNYFEKKAYHKTLREIEANKLLRAQLKSTPWSGDYWAYSRGILAARTFDPAFEEVGDWLKKFEYYKANPSPLLLEKKGQDAVAQLSPAEKYDLLLGDSSYAFTESNWQQGKVYNDETGKVEDWMGICHGWAVAAYMEPRPEKSFDVPSYDDKWKIHFYPSEVKGLLSYSWATNQFPTKFLGERCNKKNPKKDENGRIIDRECFDLNPSTWHVVITNQIGNLKKSFVMDATYDFEVWNQPVYGYSYKYFNVVTKKNYSSYDDAKVLKSQFTSDPFKKYRDDKTKYIVGVVMRVAYIVESAADALEQHTEADDIVRYVEYTYDLELDSDHNFVGGEWHQSGHPDFIWTAYDKAEPLSYFDNLLKQKPWQENQKVPEAWAEAAKASSPHGVILHWVSKGLLERSQVDKD